MTDYFFAATIIAQRFSEGIMKTEYTVITFFAANKDAAVGVALNFAKEQKYPRSQGYHNHDAIVTQPSAEHLLMGLAAYGLN